MDAQPKIRADLDFDIVAHLGYVKNVDLLTKGIYMVQIKLFYGMNGKSVAPVGMFSSPSTLKSEVQGQTLPQTPICSMCEVDDVSRTFRTRSFVVRYKDEKHELNDGVHWRLTVPSAVLASINEDELTNDHIGPHCNALLHLKFELLFAPFVTEDPAVPKADLMHEIAKLVPAEPIFSVVATQNLVIENASSGIHSYYPVHFNGSYITELDCMIHCALTGIRYPSLLPKVALLPRTSMDSSFGKETLSSPAAPDAVSDAGLESTEMKSDGIAATPKKERPEEGSAGTPDLATRSLPKIPLSPHAASPVPNNGIASDDSAEFATPGKFTSNTSKRYVPMMSPHSTMMGSPSNGAHDGAAQAANGGSTMNRISGKISGWRRSVTSTPIMEKVGTIGATSKRGLGRLSTVLTSPIAEAAARFRHEHPSASGADSTPSADLKANPLAQSSSPTTEDNSEAIAALDLSADLNDSAAPEDPTSPTTSPTEEDTFKEDNMLDVLASRAEQIEASEVVSDRYDPLMNPERWISLYSAHVIENYAAALQGMSFILNLYEHLQNSEEGVSPEAAASQQKALLDHCILETNAAEILTEVQECLDVTERLAILKEKLDLCNLQLTLHWSLLMTALRRVMTKLCPVLKTQYYEASKRFWRGQLLIHTKSIVSTTSYLPAEINQLLNIMGSQIRLEVTSKKKSSSSLESVTSSRLSPGEASASGDTSNCLWRGLQIYDADLHTNVSKLPHMILQQYIGDTNAKPSLAELNARLHHKSNESEEPSVSCALMEAVKTVKELKKSPEDVIPRGSVFLARGGLLLEEARKLKGNNEVEEGEVVDLSQYPVLRPILDTTFSSPKASTADEAPMSPVGSGGGSEHTGFDAPLVVPREVGSSVVTSTDNSPRSDAGSEQESPSPQTFSLARAASTSLSTKSNTSGRFSAKLNWADFSSTLAPTLPAEVVASPARVGKLATSVPPSHVVVLQHGFLGQSYDMQLIENAIRLEFPGRVETFVAKSSEGREQDSIAQLGKRLAFELLTFCKEHHPTLLRPNSKTKLSFIGHSMGGLIIRAALQESNLKPLLQNVHVYCSLATPHVGNLFPDSQIVATGMWALFKWKKYKALKELVLEDSIGGKAHKSLLYKLSENGVLTYFHKIILVSSPRDQYVPIYSARIQTGQKSENNNALGTAVSEMVNHILSPLRADQLVRLTMDNNVGLGVDVNSLIGRTAHICYLENPIAAALLVHTISAYFA